MSNEARSCRASDFFRVYRLQRPVAELAVVADSFHTKPLVRIVQSADRYQILGVNRHAFNVFEGNRDALDELPPIAGVPQTVDELPGKDRDDREGAHRAHGPGSAPKRLNSVFEPRFDSLPCRAARMI